MLDDIAVLTRRDSERTLETSALQYMQTTLPIDILSPDHDGRELTNIVAAGMGGSGLAAQIAKTWLDPDLNIPFEIAQGYKLPGYVGPNSLVIVSSCSGNTEEALMSLADAQQRGAQLAVITGGGKLQTIATDAGIARVILTNEQNVQPRMLTFLQLKALTSIWHHFGLVSADRIDEITAAGDWLAQ